MQQRPIKPVPLVVELQAMSKRVDKPWGWEIVWAEGGPYSGKLLHIRAGGRLSLQYHDVKVVRLIL
mgnify:CR=1 FL=1